MNAVEWMGGSVAVVTDKNKDFVHRWINSEEAQELFPKNYAFRWSESSVNYGGKVWYMYIIKIPKEGKPVITNEDIKRAVFDKGASGDMPKIDLYMTQKGTEKWGRMTSENIGRNIAMCVNDKVYSAPEVVSAIMDGHTQISGSDGDNLKAIEIVMNTKTLDIYPSGDVALTLEKGSPPFVNSLVQKVLLVFSVLLGLFLVFRFFQTPRSN